MAPADEYFGHYRLSVLGIANTIKDAGRRIDEGNVGAMIDGPLAFSTDAIRAWERKYPSDPWIARDLLALQLAYLRVPGPRGIELAEATESWLVHDYPGTPAAADAQVAMNDALGGGIRMADGPRPPVDAWERFAALRAPLPPH